MKYYILIIVIAFVQIYGYNGKMISKVAINHKIGDSYREQSLIIFDKEFQSEQLASSSFNDGGENAFTQHRYLKQQQAFTSYKYNRKHQKKEIQESEINNNNLTEIHNKNYKNMDYNNKNKCEKNIKMKENQYPTTQEQRNKSEEIMHKIKKKNRSMKHAKNQTTDITMNEILHTTTIEPFASENAYQPTLRFVPTLIRKLPKPPQMRINSTRISSIKRPKRNVPNNPFLAMSQNPSFNKLQDRKTNTQSLYMHNPFLKNITIPNERNGNELMQSNSINHNPWLQNATRKPTLPKDTTNLFRPNSPGHISSATAKQSTASEPSAIFTNTTSSAAMKSPTLRPKLIQLLKINAVIYPDSAYLPSTTPSTPHILDIRKR